MAEVNAHPMGDRRIAYRRNLCMAATVLAALAFAPGAQAAPFFTGLGDLHGGGFDSEALGISADGSTVVGSSESASGEEAFRWTISGGMQGLGDFTGGEFLSRAIDVSADGSVIVGRGTAEGILVGSPPGSPSFPVSVNVPFRWTESTGLQALSPGSISPQSSASGVSADGSVIVGSVGNGDSFRWTAGNGLQIIGSSGGSGGFLGGASAVSADGSVVVGTNDNFEGVRWTESEGMQPLGLLPGTNEQAGSATGISADGTVIVGSGTVIKTPYRWTAEDGLEELNDFDAVPFDVSADGSVIVGEAVITLGPFPSFPSFAFQAVVWDEVNGTRILQDVLESEFGFDLTGWTLGRARAVSDDGLVIAGDAINPDGEREAFVVSLREDVVAEIPAPSAVVLFGLSVAGIGFARRRRAS